MYAIALDVPADPVGIARAFGAPRDVVLLHAAAPGPAPRRSFVATFAVEESNALVPAIGTRVEPGDPRAEVPAFVGVIPYEAGRSIERRAWTRSPDDREPPRFVAPRWLRFRAVVAIDHETGSAMAVGDERDAVERLARRVRVAPEPVAAARLRRLEEAEDAAAHVARIREVKRLIAAGDVYQVNVARRLRFEVEGAPIDVYERLARAARPPFGAAMRFGDLCLAATSPELFLEISPSGRVRTIPIKGTRPRGRDADDDARLARELDADPKERAELAMILDVERSDLGRVAKTGSVRLAAPPHVETHATVHHRVATVEGRLARGRTASDVVASMFPSGSVTGAPKIRAMEIVARLEPQRRGLYTGAYGMVAHDGTVRLAMAIRVLTWGAGVGDYWTGGGIVADSDEEREVEETEWKARQLR